LLKRISSDLGISLQALGVLIGLVGVIVAIIGIWVTVELSKSDGSSTSESSACTASSCTPSPSPTTPASQPTPTPTPAPTGTTPTEAPDPTPSFEVRRSTGKHSLILSNEFWADLDSKNPAWDISQIVTDDHDIGISGYYQGTVFRSGSHSDIATVSGPSNYNTCLIETGYSEEINPAKPGTKICVRTSDKRFAFITIEKLLFDQVGNVEKIQLAVVVWEPQHE
jgi:hypothetical protein